MSVPRKIVKVPVYQNPNKSARLEDGATVGAQIGVNLFDADGALINSLSQFAGSLVNQSAIRDSPPTGTGLYGVTAGVMDAAAVTVGPGLSRVAGVLSAPFDGAAVDARVQAAGYTIAGSWTFSFRIIVQGVYIGLGLGSVASNVAIGGAALAANTTGNNCLAYGYKALFKNTTGAFNVAVGAGAMEDNVSASNSVAIGGNAMQRATAGNNIAIGTASLSGATSFGNVAIGTSAAGLQTSAQRTVSIGESAGKTLTAANANVTGSNNTFVGAYSGPASPTQVQYGTAIGSTAVVLTSNTVVLGRATDNTVIGATGDDSSGAKLQVTGAIKATTHYKVGANQVVGARDTGWSAMTGTATKSAIDTATATTAQLAERVKALTDALIAHGLIGA